MSQYIPETQTLEKQNRIETGLDDLEDAATESHGFEHLVETKSSNEAFDGASIVSGPYG